MWGKSPGKLLGRSFPPRRNRQSPEVVVSGFDVKLLLQSQDCETARASPMCWLDKKAGKNGR